MYQTHVSGTRRTFLRAAAAGALTASAGPLLAACDDGTAALTATDHFGGAGAHPLDVVVFNGGFGDDYAKEHEAMFAKRFPGTKVTHTSTKKVRDDLTPRFADGTPP